MTIDLDARGAARRGARGIEEITKDNGRYYGGPDHKNQSAVVLLADLRHYCQKYKLDFETALSMSELHYEAERNKRFRKR